MYDTREYSLTHGRILWTSGHGMQGRTTYTNMVKCGTFHKSGLGILKISIFTHFIGQKITKLAATLDFLTHFGP